MSSNGNNSSPSMAMRRFPYHGTRGGARVLLQPALLTMAMVSPVLWLYTLATSFTPLLHPLTERLLQQPCRPAALLARADDQQPALVSHLNGWAANSEGIGW